jgi:hypothetical protein
LSSSIIALFKKSFNEPATVKDLLALLFGLSKKNGLYFRGVVQQGQRSLCSPAPELSRPFLPHADHPVGGKLGPCYLSATRATGLAEGP